MDINVIHSGQEYQLALRTIAPCFDDDEEVEPGPPEGDCFTLLALMTEAYEQQDYPGTLPAPVAAIEFPTEQGNMKVADLVPFIGAPNRVHEVLNSSAPTCEILRAVD